MSAPFADRLIERALSLGTVLCAGFDPFPDRIPALFGDARSDPAAVARFCEAALELAAPLVPAIKPQAGLFEPYGGAGVGIIADLTAEAKAQGALVILDAKRGDIGTTAEGYAQAALGPAPGIDADAVTVNAFMGLESIEPFVRRAEADGKGVAVLVRTSNPGARDLQDLDVGGAPLWVRLAELLQPLESRLMGASGWSSLMVVVGATVPEEARRLRTILPRTLVLAPGYGAQGASAADAMAAMPNGVGGLVNASRSILYPPATAQASSLAEWRLAVSEAIASAVAELPARR